MKRHDTLIVFTGNARNDVSTSNKDCKQSTEAVNWKSVPGTATGTQLSAEVSYFFVSLFVGLPTFMCLKKDYVLSFGTSRNYLFPSHTFTKSSTLLSLPHILFSICLPNSLGVVYLPYVKVWLYSNMLPYFYQMINRTLIPSYTLPKSLTVLSLGFDFL